MAGDKMASRKRKSSKPGGRGRNGLRHPLDLLRVHHEKIEAWILKEAGIDFDPAEAAPGGLRVVA
jgi:hypothetical protein